MIRVTFFDSPHQNCFPSASHDFTWDDLQAFYKQVATQAQGKEKGTRGYAIFARMRPATKESLEAVVAKRRQKYKTWSPTADETQRAMKFGYRNRAHLVEVTALCGDYDLNPLIEPTWAPADWPCAAFAHSTHSYHPVDAPGRYRVIIPLKEPIPPERYDEVVAAINSRVPNGCAIRAGHQPAFFPTCPSDVEVQFGVVPGEPLDWEALLAAPVVAPTAPAAITALANVWPISGEGHCHEAAMALGGILAGSDWDEDRCLDFAEELFAAAGVDNRCSEVLASIAAKRGGERAYGYPKLRECLRGEERVVDEALDGLAAVLVPPDSPGSPGSPGSPDSAMRISRFSEQVLSEYLVAGHFKGAVYDEGLVWQQAESGIWTSVRDCDLRCKVMELDGTKYVTTDEKPKVGIVGISNAICNGVVKLMLSTLERRTAEGFFADRTPGLAFQNGLLRADGGGLVPLHAARVRTVLPMDYPPSGPADAWEAFTASVWGDDQESIDLLHEILGYLLAGRMDQQKAFVFKGPPRAGKGVIFHIIEKLVGESYAGFTVSGLGGRFGLHGFVGKTVAVHPDFRRGRLADEGLALQRFLSITAGDKQHIERKGLTDLSVELSSRLVIGTNVTFSLSDLGGAMTNRLIFLTFPKSHLGSEDLGLLNRLLGCLPGIVHRALEGLARLDARGRFSVPQASLEEIEASEEREDVMKNRCIPEIAELDPESQELQSDVHKAMRNWRADNDSRFMPVTDFWDVLRGLGVGRKKVGTRGAQLRLYVGIKLRRGVGSHGMHGSHGGRQMPN